jgi:GT2 family glycosyltransferase
VSRDSARPEPFISVSLVTFNGMRWLPGCLASLDAQDAAWELLIVDNASTDGTAEWLGERARSDDRVAMLASPSNLGYAAAHNRNIAAARAEYVCLLNQDVELDGHFLAEAMRAFGRDPRIGAVQARVRRLAADGKRTQVIDTTGLVMQRSRRFVSRSQGLPESEADLRPGPVFGADGPVPVYRRAALLDVRVPASGGGWEVLDEDFFMYKEDVDLAWRMKLLGWGAWYAPAALAWHARGAGGPSAASPLAIARTNRVIPGWIKAVSWRNQRLMQLKNEPANGFLRDLPWVLSREVLSLAFILLADPARLRIVPSLLERLPAARRKRRYLVQRINERAGRAASSQLRA